MTDDPSGVAVIEDASTRETILRAALSVFRRDGLQRMTARAIGEEAGVNHALINYYFGGKQKLLLAMLERLESDKFERQWQMYEEPDVPLSRKWRQAVQFYRDDLADGYVRIQHELQLAGSRDPEVADRMDSIIRRWRTLLTEVARELLPPLGVTLPIEYVIGGFVNYWLGMNQRVLEGGPAEKRECFEILEYIGDWLEERERVCLGSDSREHV